MSVFKNKLTLIGVLIFSIFALIAAYYLQYVLGYQPCNLCLIERIPYFISIILIFLIFILDKYKKIITIIVGLLFMFGAFISFYHFGIEQGFFNESLVCNLSSLESTISTRDLLKELEEKTISCKDVAFTFFGLSLATFNTIISFGISVIILSRIVNYEKNK
tara:strand:- start:1546 stop:2031 length:486 start_codon:yes stop_codon:yes gene_type:complete